MRNLHDSYTLGCVIPVVIHTQIRITPVHLSSWNPSKSDILYTDLGILPTYRTLSSWKPPNQRTYRCDERLKAQAERSTRLAYLFSCVLRDAVVKISSPSSSKSSGPTTKQSRYGVGGFWCVTRGVCALGPRKRLQCS